MTVIPHDPTDRRTLEEKVAREPDAKQRDRHRVVLLAMDGLAGDEIALRVGRSPRFVDEWAGRYRAGGIDALAPRKQPGRRPKPTAAQDEQLKRRLDAGPTEADGVCAPRGRDICKRVEAEFGVKRTLGGIYDVLRRIGCSCLVPRPRHRKNDPAAVAAFREDAPLLSAPSARPTLASGSGCS
jgi:transposase